MWCACRHLTSAPGSPAGRGQNEDKRPSLAALSGGEPGLALLTWGVLYCERDKRRVSGWFNLRVTVHFHFLVIKLLVECVAYININARKRFGLFHASFNCIAFKFAAVWLYDLDFVLMYRKRRKERKLLVKETKSNEKCTLHGINSGAFPQISSDCFHTDFQASCSPQWAIPQTTITIRTALRFLHPLAPNRLESVKALVFKHS